MQIEEYYPEEKRILPETKFTEFPTLSVDPSVEISRSASEIGYFSYLRHQKLLFIMHIIWVCEM